MIHVEIEGWELPTVIALGLALQVRAFVLGRRAAARSALAAADAADARARHKAAAARRYGEFACWRRFNREL